MIVAGVDIGSLSAKAVLLDESKRILGYSIVPTGASSKKAAVKSFAEALAAAGVPVERVCHTVVTGYGRQIAPIGDDKVTEISCHARGVHWLFPQAGTVIDIGGQDSKVIRLGPGGKVSDFAMNDKCAAGTGRFLEVMARALEVELEEMGALSLTSKTLLTISSTCTVFAESEVVSLIAQGAWVPDIASALHRSIAVKVLSMAQRMGIAPPVALSGGVAKNLGVVRAIEEKLEAPVLLPEEPQIVGALGAALIALEKANTEEGPGISTRP